MLGDGEGEIEGSAVMVTDGAYCCLHLTGKLRGDVEAEAGGVGAHGYRGGRGEGAFLELAPDFDGEGGAFVANFYDDVFFGAVDFEDGVGMGV